MQGGDRAQYGDRDHRDDADGDHDTMAVRSARLVHGRALSRGCPARTYLLRPPLPIGQSGAERRSALLVCLARASPLPTDAGAADKCGLPYKVNSRLATAWPRRVVAAPYLPIGARVSTDA